MKTMIGAARVVGILVVAQAAAATLAYDGEQVVAREAAQTLPPPSETPQPQLRQPLDVRAPPARVVAPPNRSRRALPKGQRGWMSRILEAYPQEARLAQWEGRVGVSVEVDTMGRARSCQVTQSSGHAILDESACAGMKRYARFEPALDDDGQPMVGNHQLWVPYLLK